MSAGRFAAWTVLLALAAAGTARAQTAPMPTDLAAAVKGPAPKLDFTPIRQATGLTEAQAEALRSGVARTAVDRRLDDKLTASLGFLCGMHGDMDDRWAAGAQGSDPHGRFVGAKLSLAFR
jgi:hypothetical protein